MLVLVLVLGQVLELGQELELKLELELELKLGRELELELELELALKLELVSQRVYQPTAVPVRLPQCCPTAGAHARQQHAAPQRVA